jgi:hypothetical protein
MLHLLLVATTLPGPPLGLVLAHVVVPRAVLVVRPRMVLVLNLVRTMCGSRTGGWSLPGVMSD